MHSFIYESPWNSILYIRHPRCHTSSRRRKFFLLVQLNQNTKTKTIFKSGSKTDVICKGDKTLASEIIGLAAKTDSAAPHAACDYSLNYPNRLWEKQSKASRDTEPERAEPEGSISVFLPDLLYSAKNSHCGHLSITAFSMGYHK